MDAAIDWKAIALYLLGALVSVLVWLGKRLEKRVSDLERHSVTKADFEAHHKENVGRLDKLGDKIDRGNRETHKRIDSLFERLPQ